MRKKRKTENWSDQPLPDGHDWIETFVPMSAREGIIFGCAILDSLLGELIAVHLRQDENEIHAFLGFGGEAMAPCGAFGAKIQMAYLTSLIDEFDLKFLRCLKKIRNKSAHNARFNIHKDCPNELAYMTKAFKDVGDRFAVKGRVRTSAEEFEILQAQYDDDPDVGWAKYAAI